LRTGERCPHRDFAGVKARRSPTSCRRHGSCEREFAGRRFLRSYDRSYEAPRGHAATPAATVRNYIR
jgi:hypothetical protein